MKLNISVMKIFIKLLVLMIVFALLFIISAFLYSARYWPDVYNYINANITITRIPTISELNLTVFEIIEYNTETYSTTDNDYLDASTVFDTNTEDYVFGFDIPKSKVRRAVLENMEDDYGEVPKKGVLVDYSFDDYDESNSKVMNDLIDESKLTVKGLKDVEILKDLNEGNGTQTIPTCNGNKTTVPMAVFPWVATIYVNNETKDGQFEYFCDGALLSNNVVLTAARCVSNGVKTYSHEDLIVILGKTSLLVSRQGENVQRVKSVRAHENFSIVNGTGKNDLAVLVLEERVTSNGGIGVACLPDDGTSEVGDSITTAWSPSGNLTLVYFDKEKTRACALDNKVEYTFCATYGNDVALCPSYGGVYVSEAADKSLYLRGLRNGNPVDKGLCFSKDVTYTFLDGYGAWLRKRIEDNKV